MGDRKEFQKSVQRDARTKNYGGAFDRLCDDITTTPIHIPELDAEYCEDAQILETYKLYRSLEGVFNHHYCASIPGILEAHLNIATAIARAEITHNNINLLALSAGNGTFEKTLSKLTNGRLQTLCVSATEANKRWHHARPVNGSHFLWGSHAGITTAALQQDARFRHCQHGFDYFIDQTALQMHAQPIDQHMEYCVELANPQTAPVWIGFVKNSHQDPNEYRKREAHKNTYKQRYFSEEQIQEKNQSILKHMSGNQVTLETYSNALAVYFTNVVHLGIGMVQDSSESGEWLTSNFNWIIACKDEAKLAHLIQHMQPFLGNDASFPRILQGNPALKHALAYRQSQHTAFAFGMYDRLLRRC